MKQTCGKTTIDVDERCGYHCECSSTECNWTVACPDGQGGYIFTSGTGRQAPVREHPAGAIVVAGSLVACARMLEKRWRRPVVVPAALRSKKLRRRALHGTPEEIAQALGLRLSPGR